MPFVPFGEYLPDQPDYNNPGSSVIANALPTTKDSYGPMPSLSSYTGALTARCQGASFVRDSSASVNGFAGDATNLYTYTSASMNWLNVTQVLAAPVQSNTSTSGSGGTLAANTYYYVVTAINAQGETIASNEKSQATTGSTSTVTVSWAAVSGATGYRIYRGTAADGESVYYAVGVSTTYTDTGSASTNGTPPAASTAYVPYSASTQEPWTFVQFDQRVVALNISIGPQTFLMGTDSRFSLLSSGAPMARYGAAVRDFLVVANTNDGSNGVRPQRVWWSAIGDATNWPTPGTVAATQVQSDYQDLLGDGGWNQGIVGGLSGADMAVFQERRIWSGIYIGSPAIFQFTMVDAGRGTPAPGSIVQAGGVAYYLSDSGFFAFDGVRSVPIGDQKVDATFWADVDQNYLYRVSAVADPLHKLIFWAYPGAGNSNGTPNKILVFHYALNRWSVINAITLEILTKGMSVGYTLDNLNPFGTLDNLPYSLDSRSWTGGRLSLGAFDTTHKFGFFQGSNLSATMQTTETELNDKGLAFVNRIWAECDSPAVMAQVGYRNRIADALSWTPPSAITTTTGSVGARATGRFHRASINIPAGAAWSLAQGVNFDARPAGQR